MKTKEELNALKEEVEALIKKLAELSEDELKLVTGGIALPEDPFKPTAYEPDENDENDDIVYAETDRPKPEFRPLGK